MPDEKDDVLAYYAQVLQDIRDITARAWNFITILVLITGGVFALNIRTECVRLFLFVGVAVAAISTFGISKQSFKKLHDSRTRLEKIIEKMPSVKQLRDEAKGDDVRRYDEGDYWFLVLDIIAFTLSVLLVYFHMFRYCT